MSGSEQEGRERWTRSVVRRSLKFRAGPFVFCARDCVCKAAALWRALVWKHMCELGDKLTQRDDPTS